MLGALTRALRQDKEIKEKEIRKEEVKLFLFADEMILYLRDSRHHQKNPITDKYFQQSNKIQKSVAFLYKNSQYAEKEIRKIALQLPQK